MPLDRSRQRRKDLRRIRLAGSTLVLACGLLVAAFIRLAPPYIDHGHQPPHSRGPGDYHFSTGHEAVRQISGDAQAWLRRAETVVLATPRTSSLPGAQRVFEARSLVWGFPDYTSVWVEDGDPSLLVIRSTARYGNFDFGVNRARIERWLAALGLEPVHP